MTDLELALRPVWPRRSSRSIGRILATRFVTMTVAAVGMMEAISRRGSLLQLLHAGVHRLELVMLHPAQQFVVLPLLALAALGMHRHTGRMAKRLRANERQIRLNWQLLTENGDAGPLEPQEGFRLLVAEKHQELLADGETVQLRFQAAVYSWNWDHWRRAGTRAELFAAIGADKLVDKLVNGHRPVVDAPAGVGRKPNYDWRNEQERQQEIAARRAEAGGSKDFWKIWPHLPVTPDGRILPYGYLPQQQAEADGTVSPTMLAELLSQWLREGADGRRKAAALCLILGPAKAAALFALLDVDEIDALALEMAALPLRTPEDDAYVIAEAAKTLFGNESGVRTDVQTVWTGKADPAEVAAAWFDFQQAVAAENRRVWQEQQAAGESARREQAEAEALVEQRRQNIIEQAQLAELLDGPTVGSVPLQRAPRR